MKTSTLRTPLEGGLTLERVLKSEGALSLTVTDASEKVIFLEEINLSPIPNADAAEQVY